MSVIDPNLSRKLEEICDLEITHAIPSHLGCHI